MVRTLLMSIAVVAVVSCTRVKNKVEQVTEKVTDKVETTVSRQMDKVFPTFDSGTADTENNKKRFRDFLKVDVTDDVKNIYCFDDGIGIDQSYMFAFNCNRETSSRIIAVNELRIDTINNDGGFGIQRDFTWWDKEQIAKLKKHSWTNGRGYFKYYWYDEQAGKAYFFDFDM